MGGTFKFTVGQVSGVVVVEIRGALTSGDKDYSLRNAVTEQINLGRRLFLINIKHVEIVNSIGLGLLILIYKRVREADGYLIICGGREQRAGGPFKVPGMKPMFPIHLEEDCKKALADLMKRGLRL